MTEQLERRLERATDAHLQRLAQYNRPTWRTRVVRAVAMRDDDSDERAEEDDDPDDEADEDDQEDEERERKEESSDEPRDRLASEGAAKAPPVVLAQQSIEVLDGASLSDVRKLITTFCADTIPRRFVFQVIHRRLANGVDDDERDVSVEEALDSEGVITVLIPPVSTHRDAEGRAVFGLASRVKEESRESHFVRSGARPPPAFSAARILFGDVAAAVDVYIRRGDSVTLELSAFSDVSDAKLDAVTTGTLTIKLSLKMLADKVGMSEGMASILLSSSGGQTKIIKKLLRRLHVFVSTPGSGSELKELRWQWTARNEVQDADLRVHRRAPTKPAQESLQPLQIHSPQQKEPSPSNTKSAAGLKTSSARDKTDEIRRVEQRSPHSSVQAAHHDRELKGARSPEKLAEARGSNFDSDSDSQAAVIQDVSQERNKQDNHGSAMRKSSVEVNTSSVRSCLEIASRLDDGTIPACFAVQMIFVELMLRNFAASLPAFVSELRPVIKDIYRSSSQPPTPENVVKSVDLLWVGLFVTFWESKIQQIEMHFHKVTVEIIAELRITLCKAQFEFLKSSPVPTIPSRVMAVLRALSLISTGDEVDDRPLEKVIKCLGLNVPASRKRMKVFDLVQQKRTSWTTLTPASRGLLLKYVEDSQLTEPISAELDLTFSFSLLRDSLVALLNFMDFDLQKYVRRTDLLSGAAVKQLQREISTVLNRAEERSLKIAIKSSKASEAIVLSAMSWIRQTNLGEEQIDRFAFLLQFHGADPARWYKASKDCEMFASCPRPSRVRWYVEPRSTWCELDEERYTFVAEADLVFEFIYMEYEDTTGAVSHNAEDTLVLRALRAWFDMKNTIKGADSESCSRPSKIAFGVNYRFGGHPAVFIDDFPALTHILGYQHVDSLVIGCSSACVKGPRTVLLRCFVQEMYAQQQGWSMPTYLQRLQQNNHVQRRLIHAGALPLVRLMALREQHTREPVVCLDEIVQIGGSEAHKALEIIFRSAGRYDCLVLSPAVTHTVLDLIVRRRVDLKFGCDFLCNLRTFIEESSNDAIAGLMNQRYERLQNDKADTLMEEADVYDVLWLLASRRGLFPSEWSSIAHDVVNYVFFVEEIQSDARVFLYSLLVDLDEMMLQLDNTGRVIANESHMDKMLQGGRLQYFERIIGVVQATYSLIVSPSSVKGGAVSKLDAVVARVASMEAFRVLEGLLARYFAVARTEHGISTLGMKESVCTILVYMLEGTHFSSSMVSIAAEHVEFIARICTTDDSLRHQIVDMQFVEHMLDIAWTSSHEATTAALLRALAVFSQTEAVRRQTVYAISRLLKIPHRLQGVSLMQNIIPVVVGEEDLRYLERVIFFGRLISAQHRVESACSCLAKHVPVALMTAEDVQATTRQTATELTDRIISQVMSKVATVGDDSTRPKVSAATRFLQAARIQRSVLKWLYSSRGMREVYVRAPKKNSPCMSCATYPSLVGEVIAFINSIQFATFDHSPSTRQDVFVILRCIQVFVQCPHLSVVLASDFRLHYTLLKLASHRSQAVRALALSSLAELCWHSKEAFHFANSRLSKLLWRNIPVVLHSDAPQFCSWIEHAVDFAIGTMSSLPSSPSQASYLQSSPGLSGEATSEVPVSEHDLERDSVSSMLAVLSFCGDNSDIILRVGPRIAKTMNQWICVFTPYAHVKLLVTIQNAIVHTPSLNSITELALSMFEDLGFFQSSKFVNDSIARSLLYGIMWICCTCERIRKQAVVKAPDSMIAPTDTSFLAADLNAIGLFATISVDSRVLSVSGTLTEQLYQMYLLLHASVNSNAASTAASTPRSTITIAQGINRFSWPTSSWVKRHQEFELLPQVGTMGMLLSWNKLALCAMDQIFRWLSIVVAERVYDDSVTNLALISYIKLFGYQVGQGGVSAYFALETLPHVFRSASANPGVALQRDGKLSTDDPPMKMKKVVMNDSQVATIVAVLGHIIGHTPVRSEIAPDGHKVERTGVLRRAVLALWGLQVMSSRAQSLSLSLTPRLVEFLNSVDADNDLRIAILGLLLKMYRAHAMANPAEAVASKKSDHTQSHVLRVVVDEFALIMDMLRGFTLENTVFAMVIEIDKWSTLALDKQYGPSLMSSASSSTCFEVVTQVRWPVEVLSLLTGSIIFDKIKIRQDYYDVLIKILVQLDSPRIRTVYILGRDEVVLGIASILRAFCSQLPLSTKQTELCVRALFDSEPLMTYACDLAAVCHTSIQTTGCIDALLQRHKNDLLLSSLRFVGSGDLRLNLLSNCLDMMTTIAAALGESAFMDEIRAFEKDQRDRGSSVTALFGQAVKIFEAWESYYNRFVLGHHGRERQSHDLKSRSTVTEIPGSYRPRPYQLDETTRELIQMVLQLVNFKYWCDEMPSASHSEVLLASADANAILVMLLRQFGDDSRETATVLMLATDALSPASPYRVFTDDSFKDPLERLVGVVVKTYFAARECTCNAFHSRDVYEAIYGTSLSVLVLLTSLHRACHTIHISRFFVHHYSYPVFSEASSVHIAKLVRLFRQCCCNAYVYRIIRLGKKSLWAECPDHEDLPFFRKLGQTFLRVSVDPQISEDQRDQMRFDLALFLVQQDFSFVLAPDSPLKNSDFESARQNTEDIIHKPADEATAQLCLRDQFSSTPSRGFVSYAAKEFEAGLQSMENHEVSSDIQGIRLCNELIEVIAQSLKTHSTCAQRPNASEGVISLLGVLFNLLSALQGCGEHVISDLSWTRVLFILETTSLGRIELSSLLDLFRPALLSPRHDLTSRTDEVIHSLTARLGLEGIQAFGRDSCLTTLAFLRDWVSAARDSVTSRLFTSPRWVERILEMMSLFSVSNANSVLGENALLSFASLTQAASDADRQSVLHMMTHWKPATRPPSSTKNTKSPLLTLGTAWHIVLHFLYERHAATGISLQSTCLELLQAFASAQPEVVGTELVRHNAMPFLVKLLHDPERGLANSALCLLHRICCGGGLATTVLSALLHTGVKQSYYNGPLAPVPVKAAIFGSDSRSEAPAVKRDQAKIADLLMRQPICGGMTPSEVVELASDLSSTRFQPGEPIPLAASSSSRFPPIFVVASGVVEWCLTVKQMHGKPLLKESACLGKGALLGARSMFDVRKPDRFDVVETATATNDVVCLVITDLLWNESSSLGLKARVAVARACGAWHRWLRPRDQDTNTLRSVSHGKHLMDLASGDFGANEVVQNQAADLLRITCASSETRQLELNADEICNMWMLLLMVPLLQLPQVPCSLRLEVLRQVVQVTAERPRQNLWNEGIISLGRNAGRLDGLIVLGRAFRVSLRDPECLVLWLRSAVQLVSFVNHDHEAMRRTEALVGAMSNGAILQLAAICLARYTVSTEEYASAIQQDAWSVLLLVCCVKDRLRCLTEALTDRERADLVHKVVGNIDEDTIRSESVPLALLTKFTTESKLCVLLWSPRLPTDGDTYTSSLLRLLVRPQMPESETESYRIVDVLNIFVNSLNATAISADTKQAIIVQLHQVHKSWFANLASVCAETVTEQSHVRAQILLLIAKLTRALAWVEKTMKSTLVGGLAEQLLHVLARPEWLSHLTRGAQPGITLQCHSVSWTGHVVSAMRILYQVRHEAFGDFEDVGMIMTVLLDARNRTNRSAPQYDPAILAVFRHYALYAVDGELPSSFPRELLSASYFIDANASLLDKMILDRRKLRALTKRLLLLRYGCSLWQRSFSGDSKGDVKCIDLVTRLLKLAHESTLTAKVHRTSAYCLFHLFQQDDRVRQLMATPAIEYVLAHLFGALTEGERARKAKVKLLHQVVSCVPFVHENSVNHELLRPRVSAWMEGIIQITLERDYDVEITRMLVSVARWLLAGFKDWCLATTSKANMIEGFIQRIFSNLVTNTLNMDTISTPTVVEMSNEAIIVISTLFASTSTCYLGATLNNVMEGLLAWTSRVTLKAQAGVKPSEQEYALVFSCLSAINQLLTDERYSSDTSTILRSEGMRPILAWKPLLDELAHFECSNRCIVLDSVVGAMRAIDSSHKRDAQKLLYTAWQQAEGWRYSVTTTHFIELNKATVLARVMCADNNDFMTCCLQQPDSLSGLLQNNLRRCKATVLQHDASVHLLDVFILLQNTLILLRQVVHVLATMRRSIHSSLFEDVISTAATLQPTGISAETETPPLASAKIKCEVSCCLVVETCFRYHLGYCRKLVATRQNDVLATTLRCLQSLLRQRTAFKKSVGVIERVSRAVHIARHDETGESSNAANEAFAELFTHMMPLLEETITPQSPCEPSADMRASVRLLEAAHALTKLAPLALGSDVVTLLGQRGVSHSSFRVFIGLYPTFASLISPERLVDLVFLGVALADDDATLLQLFEVVQSATDLAARSLEVGTRATYDTEYKVIIAGSRIYETMLKRTPYGNHPDQWRAVVNGQTVFTSMLSCVSHCLESRPVHALGETALCAAHLMTALHTRKAVCLDQDTARDILQRMSDTFESQPKWEVAWLATSVMNCVDGDGHLVGRVAASDARILRTVPHLVEAATKAMTKNHLRGCFHLLGLLTEILRMEVRSCESKSERTLPTTFQALMLQGLRVRSKREDLATLALVCWYLNRKTYAPSTLGPAEDDVIHETTISDLAEEVPITTTIEDTISRFLPIIGALIHDHVNAVCDAVISIDRVKAFSLATNVWEPRGISGSSQDESRLEELIPALTLLDYEPETRLVICTWASLLVVNQIMCDPKEATAARLLVERTNVVGDAARLVAVANALPNALLLVVLQLLARVIKSFRLFACPVVNEVDISSLCRLVRSRDARTSTEAMHTLWQILRNRALCHRFAASARAGQSGTPMSDASFGEAVQYVKELVYMGILDEARLEAAYGVLVQLTKAQEALDVVLLMDELHPNAIFLDDPHSLLSAVSPSPLESVLLQQCKLLKHVARWRPDVVLAKSTAMACLAEGIISVASVADQTSSTASIQLILATGEALLSLVEATKSLPDSNGEHLRDLLTANKCAVLDGCYRNLRAVLNLLQTSDAGHEAIRLVRALTLYSSLFFCLTSTKRSLCLRTQIVEGLTSLPKTILLAISCLRSCHPRVPTLSTDDHVQQLQLRLIRMLRRITVVSATLIQFRTHDPLLLNEPFDLLVGLLHDSHSVSKKHDGLTEAYDRELLLVLLHVTRDPTVSTIIASRHDALSSLFQYHSEGFSTAIIVIFWQVVRNVVEQSLHVIEIMVQLVSDQHIDVLSQEAQWAKPESQRLALAVTSALRAIADRSAGVHHLVLKYTAVFDRLLCQSQLSSQSDPVILENIATVLAGAMRACSKDFVMFCDVLALMERVMKMVALEDGRLNEASNDTPLTMASGLRLSIERLVCAVCDLLLSFHEDETNNSLFPGYEIKIAQANGGQSSPQSGGHTSVPTLQMNTKKTGVYCKGYSPPSSAVLNRIICIFSAACSLQMHQRSLRRPKRKGRSVGGDIASVGGNCIVYITDFFFQVAKTPSGRFFFLNPSVIHLWFQLIHRMDPYSLQKLCDGLVLCTLSKHQTIGFLSSSGLQLLVVATCKIIKDVGARVHREHPTGSRRLHQSTVQGAKEGIAISDAFLQFIVAAAVMTERPSFLQSTFYLVHAGASHHITVAGLVLASIVFASGCSAYLKLACKVLGRFLTVFTFDETKAFLQTCKGQMARALAWDDVCDDDVMLALITMIEQTEGEAIMKQRVLVKIIHSTLLRTAVLGLIDKGIPEVLHDFGLKSIMDTMKSLKEACQGVQVARQGVLQAQTKNPASSGSTARRRNSLSGVKTSVEKLTAGLTAVSGAALTAGVALLATPFQEEDENAETDPQSRFTRRLERCTETLKDAANVIAEYAMTGYPDVFKSFENANEDLELIAAMQSSTHAISLTQATFYTFELIQEAIVASISEREVVATSTASTTRDTHGVGDTSASKAGGSAVCEHTAAAIAETGSFLKTLEDILGLITVSLQHNDMDILFYGHKLQQIGRLVDTLFQLPIVDEDHDTGVYRATDIDRGVSGGNDSTPTATSSPNVHNRRPSITALRRSRISENFPVYLRFQSLELRSWFWSILGFLPYLRIRYDGSEQLVRFTKGNPAGDSDQRRSSGTSHDYVCHFDVQGANQHHIETSFRELPRTVDVEVWVYLPFWYQDVLVSHAKVPLLARSLEAEAFEFPFYPESSRGLHAYRPEIVGTLTMTLSDRCVDVNGVFADKTRDNSYPAYSTLGSRYLRQFLRFLARVTLVTKLSDAVSAARRRRKILAGATLNGLLDSLENDRQIDAMTAQDVVGYLITKSIGILREVTHPDKLVAPMAAAECAPLVTQLETMAPSFARTLAGAFETKNTRVWRDVEKALTVVRHLFLEKGLAFFSSHFHQQPERSIPPQKRSTVDVLPSGALQRRKSEREKRPSSFVGAWSFLNPASKKMLRDIASQLRSVHLHEQQTTVANEPDRQEATLSGRLLAHTAGVSIPSAKMLLAVSKRSARYSNGRAAQNDSSRFTRGYFHHHTASTSEWRMIYPHVSVWNLSQAREPHWHSFERMTAPTSLNHFLLQPIERLQVYCAVLAYIQPTVQRLHEKHIAVEGQLPAGKGISPQMPRPALALKTTTGGRQSPLAASAVGDKDGSWESQDAGATAGPRSPFTEKENDSRDPGESRSSNQDAEIKATRGIRALWRSFFKLSDQVNSLNIVQKAFASAPEIRDFQHLEAVRARRLIKYHTMDPFDAAARLQRLHQHARRLPARLYREGVVANCVHVAVWLVLTLSIWRVSIARDAIRDSERSFQELYASQSMGEHDFVNQILSRQRSAETSETAHDRARRRIVISDRQPRYQHLPAAQPRGDTAQGRTRRHQVTPSSTASDAEAFAIAPPSELLVRASPSFIILSEHELKHLVILLELKRLVSDVFHVWPSENGNIGLNGFWSSLRFTAIALCTPPLLVYAVFPAIIRIDAIYVRYLSYVACFYGTCWIVAAYFSIRGVTKKIPAFREVRHVERINLTDFPYSLRNYMAIASAIWEGFQLNTTSFSVWEMSYTPKQVAALTTIDLQDIGLGSLEVNLFASQQTLALTCLVLWLFCLKASNKFKSIQFLNYLLTFLLPNLLGGMLFMFLSKQFYQAAVCFQDPNQNNATVMWSNSAIVCWTDPTHKSYALRGLFGMSLFVPLGVLAYGSYQVFFPEVNLDVQTSPMLNVSAQIVKAAMMGSLSFFMKEVELFLAVSLVGNLLLLFLVIKYDVCSTWHLKYAKVLIYAMSSWSALCAMISTLVDEEDRNRLPLYTMHAGWGVLVLVCVALVRRRLKKQQLQVEKEASAHHVLIKPQRQKTSMWSVKTKEPQVVTPSDTAESVRGPQSPSRPGPPSASGGPNPPTQLTAV